MDFLRNARQLLAGGPLLLGLDQPREPALMEAAYDDAAGVSAAFARNLLQRLSRDLQGMPIPHSSVTGPAGKRAAAHGNGAGEHAGPDRAHGR